MSARYLSGGQACRGSSPAARSEHARDVAARARRARRAAPPPRRRRGPARRGRRAGARAGTAQRVGREQRAGSGARRPGRGRRRTAAPVPIDSGTTSPCGSGHHSASSFHAGPVEVEHARTACPGARRARFRAARRAACAIAAPSRSWAVEQLQHGGGLAERRARARSPRRRRPDRRSTRARRGPARATRAEAPRRITHVSPSGCSVSSRMSRHGVRALPFAA